MATAARLGFFGKLPSHGDFIERGLPHAFLAPWDRWLQAAIAESRQLLGTAWLEHYLVAPIWRFALSPGICGPDAWLGLAMPSVDRVSRYFPLTVAMPAGPGAPPLADLIRADSWLGRCEEAALGALDARTDADTLAELLRTLEPAPPTPPSAAPPGGGGCSAWQLALPAHPGTESLALAVAQSLLGCSAVPYSLWWSEGSERVEPSLLIHRGLPRARGFAAMLDGRFGDWGWDQCRHPTPADPGPRTAEETGS